MSIKLCYSNNKIGEGTILDGLATPVWAIIKEQNQKCTIVHVPSGLVVGRLFDAHLAPEIFQILNEECPDFESDLKFGDRPGFLPMETEMRLAILTAPEN